MKLIDTKLARRLILSFLAIEILSFISFGWPLVGQLTSLALILATIILASYNLEYGLSVVLAELFIGSMGHLFVLNLWGHLLPIRIALWSAVMVVFVIKLVYQLFTAGKQANYWQGLRQFRGLKLFLSLWVLVILGVIIGLLNHHTTALVLADVNAWPYFLILGPAVVIYGSIKSEATKQDSRLRTLFATGAIWLSLKTLALFFIFTHNLVNSQLVYLWLRQTLVGEMTATTSGWPRIFIQGQIYAVIAFIFTFWLSLRSGIENQFTSSLAWFKLGLGALFFTSILLSFSRSFWVASISALVMLLLIIWYQYGWLKLLKAGAWLMSSVLLSVVIIYLVASFPYIHANKNNLEEVFLERVSNGNEAALSSRWSLLPVMLKADLQEPILGQGFGATITYISYDPRVLQNDPQGHYTTYAFEWGYLDLWLKLGLLGLAAYLWLLISLIKDAWRQGKNQDSYLFIPLAASLVLVAVVHMFTPYLNHPLGIGWLVICSCLIWRSRVLLDLN
jgi:O-antigen ligase